MEKTYYLRIPLLLLVCCAGTFGDNVANISDSLAVETTVDTVKVKSNVAPVTKSKTEKRDSSDQTGPTPFTLKESEPFSSITSTTYQQLPSQPQQFQPSPASITFQPTTVRYVAEGAAPQAYYNRPPNIRPIPGPSNGGKYTNFVDNSIHYGTPIHTLRGPFKGPYQQHLKQTHPQSQQQQFHHEQQYNQQPQAQALKPPPSLSYVPNTAEGGFIPSERHLQHEQPPQNYRQQHTHTQKQQQQQNEQYSQQIQEQQPVIQKYSQQQQPYVALEKQPQPQQHQHQQPSRQQIHYIIAIPLSYVRQLQYQLAAQQGATLPPQQHQQQALPTAPLPLVSPRAPLPSLIALQPIGAGGGGGVGGSSSSLSRELYRTQQPIHYVQHAPAHANPAAGPHVQSPAALVPQQLPYPMNLVLTALSRPRPTVYPASQLLYVQPQLIRHTPQQQLQLQVKQPHHLPHYAHASDQQQAHAIEERNTQQSKPAQPQQHPHQGSVRSVPKPKVSPVSSSSPSAVTSSASPPPLPPQVTTALPIQSLLPAAPPVLFYGPTFVQPSQLEQHPLPSSPYSSYFQGQFGPAQHPATIVKLSSPSALLAPQTALTPHYYHIQPPSGGPSPFAAALSPQSLLVAKAPLQLQQSSHQHEPPALSAFTNRPAVYVAPQDAVDSIGGASWSGGGLPYFIHPAGVHYGTHLYNPGTPLVSQKLLENVANADVDNQQQQQQLRPEPDRKQQQQQLGSTTTSDGNDDNNAIVKYP
ncbi:putative mediator of RNA polymerase II transcription subunit 12 [Zeugodacus cucurbitae]|uniref:Uncharacterized protein n=1 Tax=Zeugodacus cucurbitae TaxID=28588 RepID=A0A0A1XQH2_ZEUCU|nr:putative mediator of RNA polymerase II transcription subunit 12 [Zeugodacus cucurbitae]XP_028898197.2 putative mediator of RNA polymerase II transcription subunit 12 [Zeugodacus cucurbitae]XP_028898198.2 putative mediator of RNA polymerase II transcription subunit 12 [Zeugodacus cucurbitae]XP_028898199.2 putative mediator of RNA polymerase II transcription subunit 12 [Zeugodacus cucurbitae]XP_028898202.2 putative mediator of RNA polymerase II transcription subunit 12 [Zeugodacus cucurbitae]